MSVIKESRKAKNIRKNMYFDIFSIFFLTFSSQSYTKMEELWLKEEGCESFLFSYQAFPYKRSLAQTRK